MHGSLRQSQDVHHFAVGGAMKASCPQQQRGQQALAILLRLPGAAAAATHCPSMAQQQPALVISAGAAFAVHT